MSKDTNCQGCAVQQGTHKPAEALSAISEPAQQPDAFQIATALEESFTYASTKLAADMLRAQHARIDEMEATHQRELTAYRTTVENLKFELVQEAARTAAPAAQAGQPAAVAMIEPEAWRYTDARGHYRYRGMRPGFAVEYPLLKPEPLFTIQQVRSMLAAQAVERPQHQGMTIAGNGASELGQLMRKQWEARGGLYPDGNPNAGQP